MSLLKVNSLQDLGADAVVTNGVIASSALPAGSILQVVSTTKTDTFSTSSTSFTNLTGLSASITPSSTSSKIMIFADIPLNGGSNFAAAEIERNNTTIVGSGTPVGNRLGAIAITYFSSGNEGRMLSMNHLDSPSSTSTQTYQVNIRTNTGTIYAGRSVADSDTSGVIDSRTASFITLMEVAG